MLMFIAAAKRRVVGLVALVGSSLFLAGFLESCDDRLVGLTRFIDPCGTILANCNPGDIQVRNAGIGNSCIDPTCTVPGACGGGQPLGTITDLCD